MFNLKTSPSIRLNSCVCLVAISLLSGCGESGPKGLPRTETVEVKGVVHIDGEPGSLVKVVPHPVGDTKSAAQVNTTDFGGYTHPDGTFSLSTYENGDGIPAGTYKLTFEWAGKPVGFAQRPGPDQFGGKYADPETSEHEITVEAGKPLDLKIIELQK